MNAKTRPAEIIETLSKLETDGEIKTKLEAYIADLEAKQPDRPRWIVTILKDIETHHPTEVGICLEDYITKLEANQQPVPPGKVPESTESLYWRSVKRREELVARALRKQDNQR